MPPAVKVRRLPDESDRHIETITVLPPVHTANPIPLGPLPPTKENNLLSRAESHVATEREPIFIPSADVSPLAEHAPEPIVAVNKVTSSISPPSFKNPPESVWIRGDLYGPPDPVSNLPHIKFTAVKNETTMEKRLREDRQSVHDWNHKFWTLHNTRFAAEKEAFVSRLPEKRPTADELSVFYKEFLNKYHRSHVEYNKELYRRNIRLLWPELAVAVHKIFRRIVRR